MMFSKLTKENEGIGKLLGMRHLDILIFSYFMGCQNYDNFKAGRAKGINCFQVNEYPWIPLLILCLAVLGPSQGPCGVTPRAARHGEGHGCSQAPPFSGNEQADAAHPNTAVIRTFHGNADKSGIAIKNPVNHCEIVEEPPDQSFPPGRTHTFHLSPPSLDLVVSSYCV